MSSVTGSAASAPQGGLEAAFGRLRAAVEAREAEHALRARYRKLFSIVTLCIVLGVALATFSLTRMFNKEVLSQAFTARLTSHAPRLLQSAKAAASEVVPFYRAEVDRSLPAFSERLATATGAEMQKLSDSLKPVLQSAVTGEAETKLAELLLAAFPAELAHSSARAHQLAAELRAAQVSSVTDLSRGAVGGPYLLLGEIQVALRGLAVSGQQVAAASETADALWNAAVEVVKAKVASGEGLGLEKMLAGDRAAKKGAK